jgi:tRNA pseudouridine13 synthase
MKLKRLPEDFLVEELIELPLDGGPFAVYRLQKQSLGTLEAMRAVEKAWNLAPHQLAYAGLKDKHAHTTQYFTVCNGPAASLKQPAVQVRHVGQASRALKSSDLRGNRFAIVLRDFSPEQVPQLETAIAAVQTTGVPNYFDDQRFGSLGPTREFIAHPWCLGNHERVIWLAVAEENSHDRPRDAQQKELIRKRWGEWTTLLPRLDRTWRRDIVAYLAEHPGDFRRATALLRKDLRSLYVAAFQSHLWNLTLKAELTARLGEKQRLTAAGAAGGLLFPRSGVELNLPPALPLLSARLKNPPPELAESIAAALAPFNMQLRELRIKYPDDTFFSKGDRSTLLRLKDFSHQFAADELHGGQQKLTLRFELGSGSYATMLVKWLGAATR